MSKPASIFLSHSHKDKPFVRRLAGDLQKRGVRVWVDEAEMLIGDSLIGKIGEAIDTMDFVGAILSENSVKSTWVNRELDIALNHEIAGRRVKVLPLVIDDCAMPSFLIGKLYGDFRDDTRYDETVELLMRRLGATTPTPDLASEVAPAPTDAPDTTDAGAGPFEMRLLIALNNLRPIAATLDAQGNAARFINGLGDLGALIRSSPTSLLIYKSARSFEAAFNAVAQMAGKEITQPPEEIREAVVLLMYALDQLSIEVGIQALRAQYPGDREKAARILGEFGPTAEIAIPSLRQTLKDPSGPVRMGALWALTAIGTEDAMHAVKAYEQS
ncbi:MAG: toll/interleukin-1 receptor domain-containing protein [Novosphingobium sp.]|nr:toll/interleukin-1 receptor domain-containing protein [Novosphingobium sp.]